MLDTTLSYVPLAVNFLIGVTTVLLVYWFSVRNHDYWKKKGLPYAEPLPFVGSLLQMFRKPLHEVELERYRRLGPIYGSYEGSKAIITIGDPVLLREIMVKDFGTFTGRRIFSTGDDVIDNMLTILRGEDWKRVRSIISPTFSTGKIKKMLSIFQDCARTVGNNFKTLAEEGKPIDAKRIFGTFTMDVIASSAFSTKIDSHNDPDNEFVKVARNVSNQKLGFKFLLFVVAPRLVKLLRLNIFDVKATQFFKDTTLQIIEERNRTGQVRNDFLQLLMDTAKGEQSGDAADKDKSDIAANYAECDAGHQLFETTLSKHLSMDELIAQCVIFFLAGYETTTSTLSFVAYELALQQDVQDKLRAEVDKALEENNGELTYEAVQSMKYLDNVISETLRIYPPAIRLGRYADDDYALGETGIPLPKGMIVAIPAYAMHRDPKYFPDPERFDPDRFSAEERAKRDPYAYLPFGAGPRNCVGMRFALMEIKVCLSYVIANFKISKCPETKIPLEFNMGQQGLLQAKEIIVKMEVRRDSPLVK